MPLVSHACRIWSSRLRLPIPTLASHRFTRMSTRSASPTVHEQSPKRRRTNQYSPRLPQLHGAMAFSSKSDPVRLELNEVESNLRQLLLDVATYIDETPANKDSTSIEVPEDLAKEKIVLRWTGGWVRDKLLQVGSHDIDVAINKMTGEHFGLKMQEYLQIPGNAEKHNLLGKSKTGATGDKTKMIAPGLHKIEANPEKSKNLETATTKIMGIDLDLVNLRKETYNEVSRNPQVEFGTAEEDAMRRDATINAMFYNLHTGLVEDLTGRGFDDMAAKIIRTPLEPYQTFKDDPLRVLRLIRFASRLDYAIDPETAKAMGNPEIQNVLKIKISRERVGIELEKMLKGPRPRLALTLIDRFGLYSTVFTDPTRSLPAEPEIPYFTKAANFVKMAIERTEDVPATICDTLLRNADERYLAWICATVMPWADAPTIPNPKPAQRRLFPAYLVAREGFKAPNKVCDVVAASLTNSEEIRNLAAQCAKSLRRPDTINPANDATARDTLGMAIRRWGSTWRTQVFFNLVFEIVLERVSREELLRSYSAFLAHLTKLKILDADTFRPLLKGTDLASALNTKPGPWMKDALDMVMAWQLRNPEATDPASAIDAVKTSRSGHNDSELPSRLASHFLQLTIPPFFPQNKTGTNTLEASRQPALWKDTANQFVLNLLKWSIGALEGKELEAEWRFLVPPILKMIDDIEVEWKAEGCHLLGLLLDGLQRSHTKEMSTKKKLPTTQNFVQRTGYHNIFAEALFPLFAYIPSLTPEKETVVLFKEVFPTLVSLALLHPVDGGKGMDRNSFLDKIVRDGVVSPLAHFPTPSTYPELATTVVSRLPLLCNHLAIDVVKHLQSLVPLLSAILKEPFALSHKPLLMATLEALYAMMLNTWPRIPGHRGEIMMGLCLLWRRCSEGQGLTDGGGLDEVKKEVKESVAMLDYVMRSVEEEGLKEEWEKEKMEVVQSVAGFEELFEKCGGDEVHDT